MLQANRSCHSHVLHPSQTLELARPKLLGLTQVRTILQSPSRGTTKLNPGALWLSGSESPPPLLLGALAPLTVRFAPKRSNYSTLP